MAIDSAVPRAPYACDPAHSRGRLRAEPASKSRNAFRRDCDRIIHSTAFRRLKHKTQVFVFDEGDHYRTRLTHTLEVAQIARALARALGLDEDLGRGAGARPRSRPSAVRPCRRAGAGRLPRRVRRVRPQRPDPARCDRAGAALSRIRRPEPDLGDAGGARQAQRPADRPRRRRRSGAIASTAFRRRSWTMSQLQDLQLWSFAWRSKRRSPPSPTTSPTTPTISTTGLRAGLFQHRRYRRGAAAGRSSSATSAPPIPVSTRPAWCTNSSAG